MPGVKAVVLGLIAAGLVIGLLCVAPKPEPPAVLTPTVQLDDSTAARATRAEHQRDSLQGVLKAAKELNGRLVAALAVKVAARDTVIVHDTLPTVVGPDSTRTAVLRDSTFAGVVRADIIAPPCCAPLRATLQVHRPEFRPEIGFVELKNKQYAAVVVWQGERATIQVPYFAPPKPPALTRWIEGTYSLVSAPEIAAGVSLAFHGFSVGPTARLSLAAGTVPTVGITIRRTW